MKIPSKFKGRYFYHFTHIENLESILENGFLSTNEKIIRSIKHTDIANENIQNRRSDTDVNCSPFGKVHDYVPFYFASTNPMLLSLTNNKNIDQPFIIFFAISIEKLINEGVVFTDASANTVIPPKFFNTPEDLEKLNWKAIDKTLWGCSSDEERHERMAEVLVHNSVQIEWIETIIVWNNSFKELVIKTFDKFKLPVPKVQFEPLNRRYFYFTKFGLGRPSETLVTGPYYLKNLLKKTIKKIKKNRESIENGNFKFKNIEDALCKINEDFCVIPELEGIFELMTDNKVHNENVSDHSKHVVKNLSNNKFFKGLAESDKQIVTLSAYLHDIGKGPKSKWKDEIQYVYPDHPADGIVMLERLLSEDIEIISDYQIRKICLLVGYHDLVGDILEKGRSEKELIDIKIDANELNMLVALTIADVSAINYMWQFSIKSKIDPFVIEINKKLI